MELKRGWGCHTQSPSDVDSAVLCTQPAAVSGRSKRGTINLTERGPRCEEAVHVGPTADSQGAGKQQTD